MEEDLDDLQDMTASMKIIVVGNGRVGKTSMITRFAKGIFTADYKKTLGCDFLERNYVHKGTEVNMMLWDTAGQEEYNALTRRYYKGAAAAVIAFSTVDRDSFDAIQKWRTAVMEECGPIPTILIQNKVDLIDQAVMSSSEVENVARNLNLKLFRTCVKENLNVVEAFDELAAAFLREGGEYEDADMGVVNIEDMNANTRALKEEREKRRIGEGGSADNSIQTNSSTASSSKTSSTRTATTPVVSAGSKRTIEANKTKATNNNNAQNGKNGPVRSSEKFQLGSKQVRPTKSRTGGKKSGGCQLL
eukprot:CAMPEP_0114997636 /NCGR_PEP_ID=MMETSP0216-20121206/15014_1 /TAXON_ID=223996 /ORGANISM="Protocruzia adherens, Strain Boccale" /LENGTH=303 /DNA_ID=CAMNT_0002362049 /DNA_START=38 /DNA_END=949 /DNA_ORIENTATION=+